MAHRYHGKTFFLTAKLSFPRENFLSHGKAFFFLAKLSFTRQNFLFHGKVSFSRPNICSDRMTLLKQDVNSFITQEVTQQCLPTLGHSVRYWYACHDTIVGLKTCHSRLPEGIIGKSGHTESTYILKVSGWVWSKAYTRAQGGWLVKAKAYARWNALVESLPIVQAEGIRGRNGTKLKHCSNYFRKSQSLMHFAFIL